MIIDTLVENWSAAIHVALFCVLQIYRNQVRCFLGTSVQRAGEFQCLKLRSSVQLSASKNKNGFHVREVNPSDLRMSMKNSTGQSKDRAVHTL